MPGFGVVGYLEHKDSTRIIYLRLGPRFLNNHQIEYKQELLQFEREQSNLIFEPTLKPNYMNMAKTANIDKNIFESVI
jgi:hypothetical protein